MKFAPLIVSGMFYFLCTSAFAHEAMGQLVVEASGSIVHDRHEIRTAREAIRQDRWAIAAEERHLAHDQRVADVEHLEALQVRGRQNELVARGDLRGAQKLERACRHEANEAAIARRRVAHDRNVIAIKHRQLEHDTRVLAIARGRRY